MIIDKNGKIQSVTPAEMSYITMMLLQNADSIEKIAKYIGKEMEAKNE